ncbi:hypothetical protein AJ79_05038 [Helicocarpus griseus UAMH5409]|uniref:Uncharacterized protein n=1 Tax=Helicocarpus griseus UAMH5409 TaxID=1447875 RepID=A0A2B7XPW0_9EURO|nr:hypothetical protein AJ79_05038 [Helicocarpus griseus UAMH5409]
MSFRRKRSLLATRAQVIRQGVRILRVILELQQTGQTLVIPAAKGRFDRERYLPASTVTSEQGEEGWKQHGIRDGTSTRMRSYGQLHYLLDFGSLSRLLLMQERFALSVSPWHDPV